MRGAHVLALMVAASAPRCLAAFAQPTSSIAPTLRYPVGYDPDNRARPVYYTGDTLLPPPVHPTRGTAKRARWSPPRGYEPATRNMPQQYESERSTFINHNSSQFNNDSHVQLCTGIWMGRVILHKHCVVLDRDELRL